MKLSSRCALIISSRRWCRVSYKQRRESVRLTCAAKRVRTPLFFLSVPGDMGQSGNYVLISEIAKCKRRTKSAAASAMPREDAKRESRSRRLCCGRIARTTVPIERTGVSIRAWRGRRAIMIITGIRGAQLGQRSDRNALEHASRRDGDAAARRFSLSSTLFLLSFFFSSVIKINVVTLITRWTTLPRGKVIACFAVRIPGRT